MTPKEKAVDLYYKFKVYAPRHTDGKECALIAVDEIDNIYQKLTPKDEPYFYLFQLEYWQEVKQEIENL